MAIAPRNRSVVGAFPEQIRQLGKIDGHPARLVARHAVHRSTAARLVLAVEPTNRAAAGIVDAITAVRLDDSPGGGEAAWWRWSSAASRRLDVADRFGLTGGFWDVIGALSDNFNNLGFIIIGIFVLAWALSYAIYRMKNLDDIEVRQ